jgi:hypothetical protein
MLAGNLPSAVSQTGGYLTNLGDLGLAGAISGLPGAPYTGSGQGALGQFLGNQSSAGGGDMMGALHQLTPQGLGGQPDPTALPFPGMNMVNQTYGISGGSA